MASMFVVPLEGRRVPDPERGGLLPGSGATVPKTPYWMRRAADADVAEVTPEQAEIAPKPEASVAVAPVAEPAKREKK